MATIHVDVVSAEEAIFSGEAKFVTLPGDQGRVARVDTQFALFTREGHELGLAGEDRLLGADYVNMDRRHMNSLGLIRSLASGHLLGLLEGLVDRSDHIERLLGHMVAFAVHDHLEAADSFSE